MKFVIGQKIYGFISGIQKYGVFIKLDNKTQGLVHISELSDKNASSINLKNKFKIGQKVEAIILNIDNYDEKISLSFRQLAINSVSEENFSRQVPYKFHKHFWTSKKANYGFKTVAKTICRSKLEAIKRIRKGS